LATPVAPVDTAVLSVLSVVIRVRMAYPVRANPFEYVSVVPPVEREAAHVMV
jgi:hypothetical protein